MAAENAAAHTIFSQNHHHASAGEEDAPPFPRNSSHRELEKSVRMKP